MKKVLLPIFLFLVLAGIISAQTVYKTKTGAKYHSSNCSYLSRSSFAIELKDAIAEGLTPCSRCSPPSQAASSEAKVSKPEVKSSNSEYTAPRPTSSGGGQCQATTKKGSQCKRSARPGSNYCWQHGG